MQELDEAEVTQVRVIDPGLETEEIIGPDTSEFNNPFKDAKSINAWQRRAMAVLAGSRVSKHKGGHAGERTINRRRARNKVAKQSRKINRGSYTGR